MKKIILRSFCLIVTIFLILLITLHLKAQNAKSIFKKEAIKVSGNCAMCKERIEKAALIVQGVETAKWSSKSQMRKVKYNTQVTSLDQIVGSIMQTGHDTKLRKAPDSVYMNLPECCQYRTYSKIH